MEELHFSIPGSPITKKNSGQIIPLRKAGMAARYIIVPSAAYKKWVKETRGTANRLQLDVPDLPIHQTVWVKALFYLGSLRLGDLNNYTSALADWLQTTELLSDDKLIISWDESRVRVDRANPRVDVWIRPLAESPEQIDLLTSSPTKACKSKRKSVIATTQPDNPWTDW